MPTKTQTELDIEIAALKHIKPRVNKWSAFEDDNHAAIDAQILVLLTKMNEDQVESKWPIEKHGHLRTHALDAVNWMEGHSDMDGPPSTNWPACPPPVKVNYGTKHSGEFHTNPDGTKVELIDGILWLETNSACFHYNIRVMITRDFAYAQMAICNANTGYITMSNPILGDSHTMELDQHHITKRARKFTLRWFPREHVTISEELPLQHHEWVVGKPKK